MSNFKLIKWNSAANAAICLILGLSLLIFPIESLNIGGYLIASILMLFGLSYVIKVIKNKGIETNGDIIYLIISIAFIAISITIFVDPTWMIRLINIVVGIVLIIGSSMNLFDLLKYTKDRTTSWWIYLSIVSLVLICGIVIIINPLFLAKIITRLEGASLIISTIITILLTKKTNINFSIENSNEIKDIVVK